MNKEQETCQHVWIYDHLVYDTLYMRCPRCGLERPSYPGEIAARVSRELKIRQDDKDGDV